MLSTLCYSPDAHAVDRDKYVKSLISLSVMVLVSAGLGAAFAAISTAAGSSADEQADALSAKNHVYPCVTEPGACTDIANDLETQEKLARASMITFIVGGSIFLGGTVFAIKEVPGDRSASRRGGTTAGVLSNNVAVPNNSTPGLRIGIRW